MQNGILKGKEEDEGSLRNLKTNLACSQQSPFQIMRSSFKASSKTFPRADCQISVSGQQPHMCADFK